MNGPRTARKGVDSLQLFYTMGKKSGKKSGEAQSSPPSLSICSFDRLGKFSEPVGSSENF